MPTPGPRRRPRQLVRFPPLARICRQRPRPLLPYHSNTQVRYSPRAAATITSNSCSPATWICLSMPNWTICFKRRTGRRRISTMRHRAGGPWPGSDKPDKSVVPTGAALCPRPWPPLPSGLPPCMLQGVGPIGGVPPPPHPAVRKTTSCILVRHGLAPHWSPCAWCCKRDVDRVQLLPVRARCGARTIFSRLFGLAVMGRAKR